MLENRLINRLVEFIDGGLENNNGLVVECSQIYALGVYSS